MEIINKNNMIMKKLAILGMGLCIALAFSSCKSSESAYKKHMKRQNNRNWQKPRLLNLWKSLRQLLFR